MNRRTTQPSAKNPWNEYGVSSFPPQAPMVGQEQVHRQLDTALKNFQPTEGSSAWFCALTSTWGGGKTRTADELVSEVTGQSCGWIDRTGAPLAPLLKPDFEDGVLPVMVSYKWVIRQVEDAGRKLPFTLWIPRVALAALIGLRDKASPQLQAVMEHLETFKNPVAQAIRALPDLAAAGNEVETMQALVETMKAHGLDRLLVIVEEVEDVSEIRNKPGGVLGQEAYQEIKDTYLDVIPEVLKSDTERQRWPNLGFLMLCSPAVYSTIEKIPSQARRHYGVPIGRNTVADLRGFLNHLRAADPTVPEYRTAAGDLLATTYLAVDRNMGWLNVVMYSRHRRWIEGETDPVSLLREFGDADPRGKEVFVENGLARIQVAPADGLAQKLLYGQMPVPLGDVAEPDRLRLLNVKVLDAGGSKGFTELHPLRVGLSELLETAQQEAGVQVVSGGGAQVMAGDMKIDLARLLDDLTAYQTDGAGRAVLPKDRDQFVLHVTALHGISQTGAAAQYLYPVFAKHLADVATHFGPSFAALRQIDKRLQREDVQFRLLDDEEEERRLNEIAAGLTPCDRLRRFAQGLLSVLEESQPTQEHAADNNVVVLSVEAEKTDSLILTHDSKVWVVVGNRGSSIRDTLLSLCVDNQPVRPIVVLLSSEDPGQRDILDQFLTNRPAILERVFQFPLAEVDERLLILKSETSLQSGLTNLARSLLYRLNERVKLALNERFNQLVGDGVVVRPVFRTAGWRTRGDELAELWLYLAADTTRTLTDAAASFGQPFVDYALESLDVNKPTKLKPTTELVDHETTPPKPRWPAGLARLVELLKDGNRSPEWLTRRFFGSGQKPREIVDQMLQWLEKIRLVVHNVADDTYRLLTGSDVERTSEAAQAWCDGDLATLVTELSRFTGIQQELRAGGDDLKAKLKTLTKPDILDTYRNLGGQLGLAAAGPVVLAATQGCWSALGMFVDFRRRQIDTAQSARGETLAQDVQGLEEHLRTKDIPFRDRADALGVFVKRIERRVDDFRRQVSLAKTDLTAKLTAVQLLTMVLDTPADALLVLTKLDQQLEHSTKGIMPAQTVIHHLINRELKKAEETIAGAEGRLVLLKQHCEQWVAEWKEYTEKVQALKTQLELVEGQIDELRARPTDSIFVRNHLQALRVKLEPELKEAQETLEGLQDNVDGDYAELVRREDHGGSPFDQDGTATLLRVARQLLSMLKTGPEVSTVRMEERLERLSGARSEYAHTLMSERGEPNDPGLELLRCAVGLMDEAATILAERRLEEAATLRSLVEEAAKLRDEWRSEGPRRLGDEELFRFFLKVIDETDLGKNPVPMNLDWQKLGQLKDLVPITLQLGERHN